MKREACNYCEGCGAPLYPEDYYAVDENGVAGCLAVMTDPQAEGRPCYANRVGKQDANKAVPPETPATPFLSKTNNLPSVNAKTPAPSASADTHATGGDAKQAPASLSGAVPAGQTPKPSRGTDHG